MQIDWSNEWNRRLLMILNRTSIVEVGLIAVRDVESAKSYEKRLVDFENCIKIAAAVPEQTAK